MKFEKIQRLLADNNYIADLINKSAGIFDDGKKIKEIDPLWIDADLSQKVTDLYSIITHERNLFLNDVIVVANPEQVPFPYCISNSDDHPRYIILTIIPDVELSYLLNLPIIQQMGVVGLEASELVRSTIAACRYAAEVMIQDYPPPPYLCTAKVEWITIYVGRNEFCGLTKFSKKCVGNILEGYEFDCHVLQAREMKEDLFLSKLVAAYDEDNPD